MADKLYEVSWTIQEWANSPEEAIAKAILHMPVPSNEDTIATFFVVKNEEKKVVQIDTLELKDEQREKFVKVLDGETYGDSRDEEDDGTNGQDRKGYTDNQDRENYSE